MKINLERFNLKNAENLTYVVAIAAVFLIALVAALYQIFRGYTVYVDFGDGTETMSQTYNIFTGDIALGEPERDGYRFVGWTGSNGYTPQRTVVIGRGTLGNKQYLANWSDELRVVCEDWIVDANGNLVENITEKIDASLNNGESVYGHQAQPRERIVKSGTIVDATEWGDDNNYRAYHMEYVYVGSSGEMKVMRDGAVVYRYFYVILDVNGQVDDEETRVNLDDVGAFDMYVNGVRTEQQVTDYCIGLPCGASYEIRNITAENGYRYAGDETVSGTIGARRGSVTLLFETLR